MSNRITKIEAAVLSWLEEGYSSTDILSQVKAEYPQLNAEELLVVEKLLGIDSADPMAGLLQLQRQRQQLLQRLEPRLLDEKAPVSLFNLYRGVLRDQEASLWKLMDHQSKSIACIPGPLPTVPAVEVKPTVEQPKKRAGGCSFAMLLLLFLMMSATYITSMFFQKPADQKISSDYMYLTQQPSCVPLLIEDRTTPSPAPDGFHKLNDEWICPCSPMVSLYNSYDTTA